MRHNVYLDYNATQPIKPAAREAMIAALDFPANASSVHRFGQEAHRRIERARSEIAALIGARPRDMMLTSGATEANASVLRGTPAESILVSAIEHPSIRLGLPGVRVIPVDANGVIDLDALDRLLGSVQAPCLVSVMLANNETGVVQPVAEAARIAHAHGATLHSDAAQAPERIAIDVDRLGVDFLTLSAHKIGGPQGAGALFVRAGTEFAPLLLGGGQEGGRRAGTENVAAIVGFGAAARLAENGLALAARLARLRDYMEARLISAAPDLTIHGGRAGRIGNTSCFGAPGLSAETVLIALDLAGIAVSSGAACSSGAVEPSRVLLAMGVPEQSARKAIRVSLGWATTPQDIDDLVESWSNVYRRARSAARNSMAQELSV